MKRIKVLFLSANPKYTKQLNIEREYAEISQAVALSPMRESLMFVPQFDVKGEEVGNLLVKEQPDVLHFSCHGAKGKGPVLEGGIVNEKAVKAVLGAAGKSVKLVIFNLCYSDHLAKLVTEEEKKEEVTKEEVTKEEKKRRIKFCVGTKAKLPDQDAVKFAASFYMGVGYGMTIQDAFDLGRAQIEVLRSSNSSVLPGQRDLQVADEKTEPVEDDCTPVLTHRARCDPTKETLLPLPGPPSTLERAGRATAYVFAGGLSCLVLIWLLGGRVIVVPPVPFPGGDLKPDVKRFVTAMAVNPNNPPSEEKLKRDCWLYWLAEKWRREDGPSNKIAKNEELLLIKTARFKDNYSQFQVDLELGSGLTFVAAAIFLKTGEEAQLGMPDYRQVDFDYRPLLESKGKIFIAPRKDEFLFMLVHVASHPKNEDLTSWPESKFQGTFAFNAKPSAK